jgi:hypothetical protein
MCTNWTNSTKIVQLISNVIKLRENKKEIVEKKKQERLTSREGEKAEK